MQKMSQTKANKYNISEAEWQNSSTYLALVGLI